MDHTNINTAVGGGDEVRIKRVQFKDDVETKELNEPPSGATQMVWHLLQEREDEGRNWNESATKMGNSHSHFSTDRITHFSTFNPLAESSDDSTCSSQHYVSMYTSNGDDKQRLISGTSSCMPQVHDRLYALSKPMQEEGKEKREQIALMLTAKTNRQTKKISARQASQLFERLYRGGMQKRISLGRKRDIEKERRDEAETFIYPVISNSQAEDLYERLYSESTLGQLREEANFHLDASLKTRSISSKHAEKLYGRLYEETTLSIHKARTILE